MTDPAGFAERTIEAIRASRPEQLAEGRAVLAAEPVTVIDSPIPGGRVVANLGMTRAWVAELTPAEWDSVASLLYAMLAREPVKSSPRYQAERILIHTFAQELDSYARSAGLPSSEGIPVTDGNPDAPPA